MSHPATAFRELLEAYQAAVLAKDADAFVALYDDDLHVFDMWGNWSLRGGAAWRTMAEGWFGSLGTETVRVEFTDVGATGTADFAVGHATLTFTAYAADGSRLRSLDNRVTMALRRDGQRWRVVHEHTSAPIEHATLRAILNRPATAEH